MELSYIKDTIRNIGDEKANYTQAANMIKDILETNKGIKNHQQNYLRRILSLINNKAYAKGWVHHEALY